MRSDKVQVNIRNVILFLLSPAVFDAVVSSAHMTVREMDFASPKLGTPEEFDTVDLRDAKALLDELGA